MAAQPEVVSRWLQLRFPPAGTNDELGEIAADLALRDAEIADIVLPLERAGHDRDVTGPVIDLLAEVDGIISQLIQFTPADDDEANTHAQLLTFAEALRAVYVHTIARRTH